MSITSRRPTFSIDSDTLRLYEISQMKMRHARPRTLPKRASDPVNTQLYIHHMGDFETLPPIRHSIATIASGRRRNNSQQKSGRIKNTTDIRSRRCETIPSDFQCSEKFTTENVKRRMILNKEEANGKKFIQIDILTLETYYAKNVDCKIIEKVGGLDGIKKELTNIPSKEGIADFIKGYKVRNEKLNVDDMVRSPFFAVQFTEKSSLYFGDVREGELDGKGIMITKNCIFEGEWCRSQKVQGIEVTSKGVYKGKYVKNQRSKVGQFFWSNGEYYSGQWYKSKKHGTGVWKSVNGDVYMGQWSKGKVEGYGIHLSKGGQKYEGFFINFLKDGQGKEFFPNGDYFEGIFKMGKPQGFGVYKWKNGITYEGQFKDGFRQGKGKIYKVGVEYEGTFVREKADGQGRLVVWNRSNYVGQFKRGKKQGKGIAKEKRTVFVGTWQNNKFVQKHI